MSSSSAATITSRSTASYNYSEEMAHYREVFKEKRLSPPPSAKKQLQTSTQLFDVEHLKQKSSPLPKGSYSLFNKRTALILSTTIISALSLGIFCYVMGQQISSPTNPLNPVDTPSSDTSDLTQSNYLISHALNLTSAGLTNVIHALNVTALLAADSAQSVWGSIRELTAGLFAKIPEPKPLERALLTDAEKDILKIRKLYPDQYITTDLNSMSNVSNISGIFKAVKLAAAVGEAPKAFLRICAKLAGGSDFCPLFQISKTLFNTFNLNSKESPPTKAVRGWSDARDEWDKVKDELGQEQYENLLRSHESQINASSYDDNMNRAIVYFDSEQLKKPYPTIKSNDYTRLPGIDTQTANRIETYYQGNRENLRIIRDVRSTHENGQQESAWSKYTMSCVSTTQDSVSCTMDNTLPHPTGPMSYSIEETAVNPSCSQVTERVQIGDKKHVLSYAIDPNNELPIVFNQLVNPSHHFGRLAFTGSTGDDVQGYVNMATELPAGMPKTC